MKIDIMTRNQIKQLIKEELDNRDREIYKHLNNIREQIIKLVDLVNLEK